MRLPAADPKKPLTTPDIKAKQGKTNKITFGLDLVLEVETHILFQVASHPSHLDGFNHMEERGVKHLKRAVSEGTCMPQVKAIERRYLKRGRFTQILSFLSLSSFFYHLLSCFELSSLCSDLGLLLEKEVLRVLSRVVCLLSGNSFH